MKNFFIFYAFNVHSLALVCVCLGVYGSYVELMYQSLSKPFDIIYANAPHTHTHTHENKKSKEEKKSFSF